ncbi:AA-permease domain-containing protein [Fusarium sp. Ph1]|nr:AA-permease domain-containing protein [Fusarium sp. Ph1]
MASKANQMEAGEKSVAYDARSNSPDVAADTMTTREAAIANAPLDMSELEDMSKGLHSRHLQMMALAGATRTGLFLGFGLAVTQAGPIREFLGYTLIGFSAAGAVLAVAEMAALGLIFIPTEVVAAAVLMSFWVEVNNAVFRFALLKIAFIFIVNIMAVAIIAGGRRNGEALGLRYWKDTPLCELHGHSRISGRFLGFYTTFTNAPRAFSGIGNISLAATESANARRDLLSIAILVNWTVILTTYLRFFYGCKKQGIDRNELPYKSPFQLYFSWACVSLFILVLTTSGWQNFFHGHWNTKSFMSSYFNIPFVLILYFGFRFYNKTKIILDEIPIRVLLDIANADPPPPLKPKKEIRKLDFLW